MGVAEQIFAAGFVIFWLFWAWSIVHFYRYGDKLFKLLSEKHPTYYQNIGRPRYFDFKRAIFGSPLRNFRAQKYLSDLAFKGIPNDLPNDKEILQMTEHARKLSIKLYVTFAIFFLVFVSLAIVLETK